MSDWDLRALLGDLHSDIQSKLRRARGLGHPTEQGDASEDIWLELFQQYLPKRYQAQKAHVVDSTGSFSHQIDVVIFDQQYSPFIHRFQESTVIPAESVYAVFEAKQTMNAKNVEYARDKVASVRRLRRTSLPIPNAGPTLPAKTPFHILGGLLAFESDWSPPFGESFDKALTAADEDEALDLGCVAAHGFFHRGPDRGDYEIDTDRKPATGFLFKLISQLQLVGTVPMIDVDAYADWLTD